MKNKTVKTVLKIVSGFIAYELACIVNTHIGTFVLWDVVTVIVAPVTEEILKYLTGGTGALIFGIVELIDKSIYLNLDTRKIIVNLFATVPMHIIATKASRKYNILIGILIHMGYNMGLVAINDTIIDYEITVFIYLSLCLTLVLIPKRKESK